MESLIIQPNKTQAGIITFEELQQTFHLSREIIEDLTPEAVQQLLNSSGGESDLDYIFDSIVNETYSVLYGGHGRIKASNLGYLDKLTNSVEETLRYENFAYFITSIMPDFEMNWHHVQWCDITMLFKYFCILAARDHSKSFTFSNAYPAWRMYRYNKLANDLHKDFLSRTHGSGYIFSFSIQQAIDLLDILKTNIESNDVLKEKLMPDSVANGWGKTEIVARNGSRIRVKGFGSSVRGAHPGWIMVDDGLKDNVMYSELQRKKSIDYFHSVIMNMIVPKGGVGVVGTPFHSLDLYGDLKTKKGWKVFEYPAIFPDGQILWRNRYDFEALMMKKETQGSLIFSREILVKPVTADSTIFPIEILNNAFIRMDTYTLVNNRDSFPVKFQRVVAGCDFAMSSNVGADYSVYTVWGIDDQDRMWLLYFYRQKGKTFAEQMAQLKFIHANFRPDWMVLENNQFQQIFVEESQKAGMPIVPHRTGMNKYDFMKGLPSLALKFEQGKIKIPTGNQHSKDVADMFITEFTSIAYTEKGLQSVDGHDDVVMSTWVADEGTRLVTAGGFKFSYI